MKKEMKIVLPRYKLVYSTVFVILMCLMRGITSVDEIGISLLPGVSFLAVVLMADTYEIEQREKRWEVFQLFPIGLRTKAVRRRVLVQMGYLTGLSAAGYGLFYWQNPVNWEDQSQLLLFASFLFAAVATETFWGLLSMTMVNLLHRLLGGIGVTVVLWLVAFSTFGDRIFGRWNVFAFVLRQEEGTGQWLPGTLLAAGAAILMIMAVPYVMKKRG